MAGPMPILPSPGTCSWIDEISTSPLISRIFASEKAARWSYCPSKLPLATSLKHLNSVIIFQKVIERKITLIVQKLLISKKDN